VSGAAPADPKEGSGEGESTRTPETISVIAASTAIRRSPTSAHSALGRGLPLLTQLAQLIHMQTGSDDRAMELVVQLPELHRPLPPD